MIKRWFKKSIFKEIGITFVSILTVFWLVVEVTSYFTSGNIDHLLKNSISYFTALLIIIIISFYINRPKTSHVVKIKDKDSFIEIKIGNAFKNEGALIIPINNFLDVSLNGNVAKAKSLQNKLIETFYDNKPEHLEVDIRKTHKTDIEYEIGTTVEIESNNKRFYLLVNTRKQENNRVKAEYGDIDKALTSVWNFIANESHRHGIVTIPVIGAGHGRRPDQKIDIVKKIIYSYVRVSQNLNICQKLIISLNEADVEQKIIDLNEIFEYLDAIGKHFVFDDSLTKVSEKESDSVSIE